MIERAAAWFQGQSTTDLIWVGIGFFAQLMFTMRFIVQWIASEKARRSVVPEMFWYFSLGGGVQEAFANDTAEVADFIPAPLTASEIGFFVDQGGQ